MKKKSIVFLILVMVIGAVSAFATGNYYLGSNSYTIKSGKSIYLKIELQSFKGVKVKARADQGQATIKIVNSAGRTVASGINNATFKGDKKKGDYKIVVTNRTNKIQKVDLSWIIIQS